MWAGVAFSLVPVLNLIIITAAALFQINLQDTDYSSMLLLNTVIHMLAVLIPSIILIFLVRYDLAEHLQLRKTPARNYILGLLIGVCAIPAVNIINYGYLIIVKTFFHSIDMNILNQLSHPKGLPQLMLAVVTVSIYPAISEELLFRGIIQNSFMRKLTPFASILLTGILFGMFHMSFLLFLGTCLIGIILGILTYRTKSIFPAMIAHFSNNFIALILGSNNQANAADSTIPTVNELISQPDFIPGLAIMLITLIISCSIVFLLFMFIKKPLLDQPVKTQLSLTEDKLNPVCFLTFLPGVMIILSAYLREAAMYLMN